MEKIIKHDVPIDLNKILMDARNKNESKNNEYNERIKIYELERKNRLAVFNNLLRGKMRLASKNDYLLWLSGFLERGGIITHVYDYPLDLRDWKVIEFDFKISPLYGSQSLNLIVKKSVKFNGGDPGHSNLYFMDDYSMIGTLIPIYSDIIFNPSF